MVFTNYSKSQKFEDKSCLLVFEESSIGTLGIWLLMMKTENNDIRNFLSLFDKTDALHLSSQ